ncbi:TPA: hypothetical protein U0P99_000044 [Legionella pneumophila]|nr:hypothetical protein [Legionella pneumophila]
MNYLLDIKQDLLLTPNGGTIASNQQSAISNQQSAISNQQSAISNQQSAISNQQSAISNQQSAIDFPLFSFYSIIFYRVSCLCLGFCFISLLYLNPMELVCAFILLLFKSIAADCLLFSHNKSFLLCKERL